MNEKEKILATWINEHKTLPSQGSAAWLSGRKFRIGGSEVAILEGTNPYQNERDLIAGHLGHTEFQGNTATRWGRILEDITENVLEQILGAKNYVPGSVPHHSTTEHANSPDGVIYVPMWDALVLIEIKNPIGRIPGRMIPRQYQPQLKSGLDVVHITEFALFFDQQQRKCALEDLTPTSMEYDTEFHNAVRDRCRNPPLVLALLGVYLPNNECTASSILNMRDYGTANADDFGICLSTIDEDKLWKVHYGQVYICDESTHVPTPGEWKSEFVKFCVDNNHTPIGVIPLKTFRLNIVRLEREHGYIKKLEPAIKRVVSVIRKLDPLP